MSTLWKVVTLAIAATAGSLCVRSAEIKGEPETVKLFVREVPITVAGRTVKVTSVEQSDGQPGYSPEASGGFHVEVVNKLPVPTSLHWHGLVLPNLMDGVPFVTQEPIPPGGAHKYDFPLVQTGTYFLHSHYGLEEQQLLSAPMIIRTPAQSRVADAEFRVMLSDFSFTSPEQILKKLKGAMAGMKPQGDMKSMAMSESKKSLVVQRWDATAERLVSSQVEAAMPDIDVKYDALLANRRTLDDPEVFTVKPGQTVLLRLIAASSATNFFIDTGHLGATIVATDGESVKPLKGNFFQLAVAQRLDLLVTIPDAGGVFPILALAEGSDLRAGVLLAVQGPELPKPALGTHGQQTMGGLDNTQEIRLEAVEPLADKPVQRTLPSVLGGNMATYNWTINGKAYPNKDSLDVKQGERLEMVITNETGMSHPMHLHGHVFEVTEIDGQKVRGAKRDTISVPPKSTIRVAFDANNPGVWAYHCHILYHLAAGMFTVVKYDGADTTFWQPDKTETELANPLQE